MSGTTDTGSTGFMGGWKALVVILIILTLGFLGWWLIPSGSKPTAPAVQTGGFSTGRQFAPPEPTPVRTQAAPPPAPNNDSLPDPQPVQQVRARPSGMAFDNPTSPARRPEPPARPAAADPNAEFKIAGMTARRAEMLPDPAYWLMPGQTIPCTIVTPLNNPAEGTPFRAKVQGDVKGLVGNEIVLPADSEIYGTITTGLQRGEQRVGAIMQIAYWPSRNGSPTPVISLASTAADQMGTAGLPGNAGNDFLTRFSNVAAYALLDTAIGVGASMGAGALRDGLSGGGSNVYVNTTPLTQAASSLSGREYQAQQNRTPPFNRPQGHLCSIMVQHPLDFRSTKGLLR